MSKKTLLSESQIRTFMKLAKLEPLTPGFVEGLTESTDDLDEGRGGMKMRAEDEEELEESHGNGQRELPGADDGLGRKRDRAGKLEEEENIDELSIIPHRDEDEEDMDAEMDAELEAPAEEPAADAGKMVSVDDFLSALERALEDAMGEEVEIDADEVADDEPADAMDDMADEPEDADEMGDDEALMESITKRVAKRIIMEALSAKK